MDSPVDNSVTCETVKKFCSGHVRIWKTPKLESVPPYAFRRESELLVDQPNLILYQGMDLLARSLVGEKDAKIWGMYVGYQNNAVVTMPTIDRAYSTPFSSYEGQYGYLKTITGIFRFLRSRFRL
jgi:hypothetical protein